MKSKFTITEIAEIACAASERVDAASHRALRKAAQIGALGQGERIDAKGTQVFPAEALFRGALMVALASAQIHGADANATIEVAQGSAFSRNRCQAITLAAAIDAARAGEAVQFRRVVPGLGGGGGGVHGSEVWWGRFFTRADTPIPPQAESVLLINLNAIWAAALAATKGEI